MTFEKKERKAGACTDGVEETQMLKRGQKNNFLFSVVWVADVRKHGINLSSHSSCFVEEYSALLRLNIEDVC